MAMPCFPDCGRYGHLLQYWGGKIDHSGFFSQTLLEWGAIEARGWTVLLWMDSFCKQICKPTIETCRVNF
jgi:hypothetical protein